MTLRPFREDDAETILAVVKANYDHLHTYLHWITPEYTIETAKQFIAINEKAAADKAGQGFGIFFDGKMIGSIGYVNIAATSKKTELGYYIVKAFEGRGIVGKCAKHLTEFAFSEMGMNRVEIRCAVENLRSRAIPERLGFKLEGVLRRALWRHTRFYDLAVYGMLAEEWREV